MEGTEQQKEVIKQFLLGELNEEYRQQVEERLLTDSDYRDEILMIESELVEDYLTERLRPNDRGNFEKNYLSAPRQQRNLKLTRVLLQAAESAKSRPSPELTLLQSLKDIFWPRRQDLRWAVLSLILLAVVGSVVIYKVWQSSSQSTELQAELVRLNTPSNILTPSSSVPSVTLLPFNLRDKGTPLPRLLITSASEVAQLRVTTAANTYQNYKVEVHAIGDDQLVQFELKPQPSGDTLILQLPARVLKPNDYVVTIRGVNAQEVTEDAGEYAFRVVQQ
jgi:hypothetical protein